MPIYAYRCGSCGFAQDVIQKMSASPLTICPECKAEAFVKQLTATGFQLKGSGWYATDFKGGAKPASGGAAESTKSDGAKSDGAKSDGAKSDSTKSESAPSCPGGACACH